MKNLHGEEIKNPYETNKTMFLLGRQSFIQFVDGPVHQQILDIAAARPNTFTFDAAVDLFTLGYIHGIRAERARRKAAWRVKKDAGGPAV